MTLTRLLPQPASPPKAHHALASPLASVKSWRCITPWTVRVMSLLNALGLARAAVETGERRPSLRVTSKSTSLLAKGEPLAWRARTMIG